MIAVNRKSSRPRSTGIAKSILVLVSMAGMSLALAADPETATNPVPNATATAPDPSRQAFSANFSQSSSTGSITASFGTVPNGKRLVIENESFLCSISEGGAILFAYLVTNFGRTYLLLQKMGSGGGFDYYEGTFTSTMYADATGLGTGDITFFLQAPATYYGLPVLQCNGSIVGHTVASPHR